MNDSQQLREQMWDLVYGLLTPDETEPLVARIKSDPRAARLYAEVRLQADLVGFAAKVEDPSLVFQIEPHAGLSEQPTPARRPAAATRTGAGGNGRIWLVGIAATALAALLAVGFFWPEPDRQKLATNYMAADVSGPQTVTEGISTKVRLHTYLVSIDDGVTESESIRELRKDKVAAGQAADVKLRLVDARNEERFSTLVRTGEDGRAEVELPGEAITPDVRLEVAARRAIAPKYNDSVDPQKAEQLAERNAEHSKAESFYFATITPLTVEPEPYVSYFFLESPVAKPGDTIHFSTWNVKPFSGTAAPAEVAQISVDNSQGVPVAAPMWSVDPSGVASGSLQIPADVPADSLSLTVREANGYQAQASLADLVAVNKALAFRQSGAIADAEAARQLNSPRDAPQAKQQEQQEQLAQLDKKDGQSAPVASTSAPASGSLVRSPAPDRFYKGLAQQDVDKLQAAGPSAMKEAKEGDTKGYGFGANPGEAATPVTVVAAGQPVTVSVPVNQAGNEQLYAIANCRGVNVASARVATSARVSASAQTIDGTQVAAQGKASELAADFSGIAEQTYSFHLPPEADGEMEVALVDRSKSPAQVVDRRRVYREPSRKLNIQLAQGGEQNAIGTNAVDRVAVDKVAAGKVAAGKKVQLTLQVVNEAGQPAAGAKVVVRMWNEQLVQQAAAPPVSLDDADGGRSRGDSAERTGLAANAPQRAAASGATGSGKEIGGGKESGRPAITEERQRGEETKLVEDQTRDGISAATNNLGMFGWGGVRSHHLAMDFDKSRLGRSLSDDIYLVHVPAETVTLASTRSEAEARYAAALAAAQQHRRSIVRTLGGVALAGGGLLLVVVGAMSLRRLPRRGMLLVPVVCVAAASMLAGVIWLGGLPHFRDQQVALLPPTSEMLESHPTATAPANAAPAKPMAPSAAKEAAPATIAPLPAEGDATVGRYSLSPLAESPAARPAAPVVTAPLDPASAPSPPASNTFATTPAPAPGPVPSAGPPPAAAPTGAPAANSPSAGNLAATALPAAPQAPAQAVGGPAPSAAGDDNQARKLATQQYFEFGKGASKPAASEGLAKNLQGGETDKDTRANGAEKAEIASGARPTDGSSTRAKFAAPGGLGVGTADGPAIQKKQPAGGGEQPGAKRLESAGAAIAGRGGAMPAGDGPGGYGGAGGFGGGMGGFGPGGGKGGGGLGGRGRNAAGLGGGLGSAGPRGSEPPANASAAVAEGPGADQAAGRAEGFKSGRATAPAALYFNPQLVTDQNGRVTFEFTMPEGQTEYRLLVDALSKGRLGSTQQLIVGAPEASAASEVQPAGELQPAAAKPSEATPADAKPAKSK